MLSYPLITHRSPDALVARRAGVRIRARQFMADLAGLARSLPPNRHILNVCRDRYRFAVGFGASLLSGKISLLPPTQTPEVIRHLVAFAPDVFCLTDDTDCGIDLPCLQYPQTDPSGESSAAWPPPLIEESRTAAYVFTSGSTGTPLPHQKTWGALVRCVRAAAQRLGLVDQRTHTLLGTVPAQHMYGLESTVLLALQSGNAFCAEHPFYPAEICEALGCADRPRILVSTPLHLRVLLAAQLDLPPCDLVLSATAPLSRELALTAEQRLAAPLLEIYGSTESGQIATRHTTQSEEWQLWPGVQLEIRDDHGWVHGGHVESPTPMADILEPTAADRFLLQGRRSDLVNIAGKRSSLGYLNHQLVSIPGVVDGVFFQPEGLELPDTGAGRVAALVVAPGLNAAFVLNELRRTLDPAFLPRPLLFVAQLPRNSTGKLTRESLRSVAAEALFQGSCPR